ncbi:MAG: SRPBCC family protein [Vicingaceae bacterium]|nr:SRPBCC family protein [Vicingaceae bacterium]
MLVFNRSQFIPISIEEAWDFFSSPNNLALITPEELGLEIKTKFNRKSVKENDLIDYTVRPILNIPMKWKTEITYVNEPYCFVDEQLEGPYKKWIHKHTFEKVGNGVMMYDEVKYELPLKFISKFMLGFIKKKLNHIFDYRTTQLIQIFNIKDAA